MQYITLYDFLLLPLYLYIFYLLVKRKALKMQDAELRRIFFFAFALRMFGSVVYSLMVQYYYGYGDSFTYYGGGDFMVGQIKNNLSNIEYLFLPASDWQHLYTMEAGDDASLNGYIAIDQSVTMMKICTVVAAISFNKFLITSLFFGLFSFAGQWKLFKVFNDINKGRNTTFLALAVLFTPSIWFWGSGLMKESICLGAIGFIVSILYKAIVKRKMKIRNLLFLALLVYLIYVIKNYVVLILVASLGFTMVFVFFQKIRNIVLRTMLTLSVFVIVYISLSLSNFSQQINDLAEESAAQIENYQKNYLVTQEEDETSRAGFEMSGIEHSLNGMLLRSPLAIFTCLFRPFIWESGKLIIFFSSLESTLLLLWTLYLLIKTRVYRFFVIIFSDPYIFFCTTISVFFALIIGFTTFNFGTMVRYKIMLLPFYYFMLVSIHARMNKNIADHIAQPV